MDGITILLCTYNGEKYLAQQLESIEKQTYSQWHLIVSDDGSQDRTPIILAEFQEKHGTQRVRIIKGARLGATAHFQQIAQTAIQTPWIAFCDQDDIWYPKKLERALETLKPFLPTDKPLLYGARTELVTKNNESYGLSVLQKRAPALENALIQSLAGGNTMVFNQRLLEFFRSVPMGDSIAHDWTLYQVATLMGGHVVYDPCPVLRYRQHDANVVGANMSFLAKWKRLKQVLAGHYKIWNDIQLRGLSILKAKCPLKEVQILERFEQMRQKRGIAALWSAWQLGLYRHQILQTIVFYMAVFLGRV